MEATFDWLFMRDESPTFFKEKWEKQRQQQSGKLPKLQ